MNRILAAYAATLLGFCAADFLWLGVVASGFYQAAIGPLLLATPNWAAAVMFYLLYTGGLMFFCVLPARAEGAWSRALGRGAFFGLVAYATYDLSNLATLRGWSVTVTMVDILWGMVVSALASTAGYAAFQRASR
jgi:uncharacterized membrane protein